MSNDAPHQSEQVDLKILKTDLPKRWKFLLTANAILTGILVLQLTGTQLVRGEAEMVRVGTQLLQDVTGLLRVVPAAATALHEATHGVDPVIENIVSAPGNVEDGNTSDRTKAYTKTVDVCVRTTRPDAQLVPGSAHFVAEVQTIETAVQEIPSPANAYCVRLTASTSAKERLARVMGRIYAQQKYPGAVKG